MNNIDSWGAFLVARFALIKDLLKEGRSVEDIINLIGVGDIQAQLLILKAQEELNQETK